MTDAYRLRTTANIPPQRAIVLLYLYWVLVYTDVSEFYRGRVPRHRSATKTGCENVFRRHGDQRGYEYDTTRSRLRLTTLCDLFATNKVSYCKNATT